MTAAEQAGGIEVSWSEPTEDAETVTGYQVLRKAQGVDTGLVVVAEVAATSWVDIDATEAGQEYRYRIKAVRGDNVGKASRKATVFRSEKLAEPEPEPEPAEQLRNHLNDPGDVRLDETWVMTRVGHRTKNVDDVSLMAGREYVAEIYGISPTSDWLRSQIQLDFRIQDSNGDTLADIPSKSNDGPGNSYRTRFTGSSHRSWDLGDVRVHR